MWGEEWGTGAPSLSKPESSQHLGSAQEDRKVATPVCRAGSFCLP